MAEAVGHDPHRILGNAMQSFARLLQDTRPELVPPVRFGNGQASVLAARDVEVAVLDRDPETLRASHRCFRRPASAEIATVLGAEQKQP